MSHLQKFDMLGDQKLQSEGRIKARRRTPRTLPDDHGDLLYNTVRQT